MSDDVPDSDEMFVRPPGTLPGDVVADRYLLGETIAIGGMGFVCEGRHLDLDRAVAVKFMRADLVQNDEADRRFVVEARAASSLDSEHVGQVFDAGRLPSGLRYLVMARLEGEDLAALLERRGPLPVVDAARFVLEACRGLAVAHAAGIVHRDVKPENLFLARGTEGREIVKVLDFGVAKWMRTSNEEGRLTSPGLRVGSPSYMSPEQMFDPELVDERTDVWALGAVLYELLTSRCPYEGATVMEVCDRLLGDRPVPLGWHRNDVPVDLERIVARCLERDPEDRYASVSQLAHELESHARPPALPEAQKPASERPPLPESLSPMAMDDPFDDDGDRDTLVIPGLRRRRGWGGMAVAVAALGAAAFVAWPGRPSWSALAFSVRTTMEHVAAAAEGRSSTVVPGDDEERASSASSWQPPVLVVPARAYGTTIATGERLQAETDVTTVEQLPRVDWAAVRRARYRAWLEAEGLRPVGEVYVVQPRDGDGAAGSIVGGDGTATVPPRQIGDAPTTAPDEPRARYPSSGL